MKLFAIVAVLFACLMFAAAAASATEDSFDILRDLTASELSQLMPGLSSSKANEYVGHLNEAMNSAGINTPARQAAFLAQLGHESGNLKWFREFASGKAYEGRKDLGNTHSGDGVRVCFFVIIVVFLISLFYHQILCVLLFNMLI